MKKKYGQNFLINENIVNEIILEANINKNSFIYEVGAGSGILSAHIIKKNPKKFISLEIDVFLKEKLNKLFSNTNYEIIFEDALKFNEKKYFKNNVTLISNLPYNISIQLLIKWIFLQAEFGIFKELILMFQKEVAERITAKENTKKFGRITLLTSAVFNVVKLKDVGKEHFNPIPKVDSTVLKLTPHKEVKLNTKELLNLEKISIKLFSNRRKKIKKNLTDLLSKENIPILQFEKFFEQRAENINRLVYFNLAKLIK